MASLVVARLLKMQKDNKNKNKPIDRREFVCSCARFVAIAALVGTGIYLGTSKKKTGNSKHKIWQLYRSVVCVMAMKAKIISGS